MGQHKFFMLLLGCKPPGRHTEQHDVFFGIANNLNELIPEINAFWPEATVIHIDVWREVTTVNGFQISILPKGEQTDDTNTPDNKLFFVNLGGYLENKFEEQHYFVLTVKPDKAQAFKEAKETLFYKHNHIKGASSHIDDKYGVDVDDLYEIDEVLSPTQKEKYRIKILPASVIKEDELHIGYLQLNRLVKLT